MQSFLLFKSDFTAVHQSALNINNSPVINRFCLFENITIYILMCIHLLVGIITLHFRIV